MRDYLEIPTPPIVSLHGPWDEGEFETEVKATMELIAAMRVWAQARSQSWERKGFAADIEALEEGEFTGWASVYGVLDEMGEIVDRGTFADAPGALPLLLNHQAEEMPLGMVTLTDTPQGLRVHGKLNLAVSKAREVWALVKQGAIRGLSIGFRTVRDTWKEGHRHIQAVHLHEISLTPFPANPAALVEAVKAKAEAQ